MVTDAERIERLRESVRLWRRSADDHWRLSASHADHARTAEMFARAAESELDQLERQRGGPPAG